MRFSVIMWYRLLRIKSVCLVELIYFLFQLVSIFFWENPQFKVVSYSQKSRLKKVHDLTTIKSNKRNRNPLFLYKTAITANKGKSQKGPSKFNGFEWEKLNFLPVKSINI